MIVVELRNTSRPAVSSYLSLGIRPMSTQDTNDLTPAEKKAYRVPRFTQHGTIQNMTLGGTAGPVEGMMGTNLMKERP